MLTGCKTEFEKHYILKTFKNCLQTDYSKVYCDREALARILDKPNNKYTKKYTG